ncbi:hypothetical protein BaRGS_00016829 [Batillaria attramentaria]|uniref:Uncharacterized protein n=1 Tax=Batillaria attramentaria TaxID=370345 RepID=A0ABD0KXV6_9CAEN
MIMLVRAERAVERGRGGRLLQCEWVGRGGGVVSGGGVAKEGNYRGGGVIVGVAGVCGWGGGGRGGGLAETEAERGTKRAVGGVDISAELKTE